MKKIMSITLAMVIIALSAFSALAFGGFDNMQGNVAVMSVEDNSEETALPETDDEEKKLAIEWLDEKSQEYRADVTISMNGTTLLKTDYRAKDGAYSVDLPYKKMLTRREIYTTDGARAYYLQFPFFYLENDKKANYVYSGKLEFVESCEENGYYVEKYLIEETGDRFCFYFLGEELERFTKIGEYMGMSDLTVEYKITSYEVDDKYMKVPDFAFNATLIYNLLACLGIIK